MRHLKLAARFLALAVSITAFASAFASDGTVGPGSAPPKLDVKTWLKGTPVTDFEPNKTYVVEFWATWCGPCLQSIPHLSELAKKNKDVTFIGVSIWEDEEGDKLPKFVKDMGDKMDYNVGYSGNQTGMSESWMKAAGQNGIPTAFVVKDQKIQWIGHPMELDKPLGEIKAGKFDMAAFSKEFEKNAEDNRKAMAANKAFGDAVKMYEDGKKAEAKDALAKVVADNPDFKASSDRVQYGWLADEDPKGWDVKTKSLLDSGKAEDLQMVAGFALQKAQKPAGVELARKTINMVAAANKTNDYLTLNYERLVYVKTEDVKEALAITNKMIELFPTSEAKDSPAFKESLIKSKAELEAKLPK